MPAHLQGKGWWRKKYNRRGSCLRVMMVGSDEGQIVRKGQPVTLAKARLPPCLAAALEGSRASPGLPEACARRRRHHSGSRAGLQRLARPGGAAVTFCSAFFFFFFVEPRMLGGSCGRVVNRLEQLFWEGRVGGRRRRRRRAGAFTSSFFCFCFKMK